MKKRQIYICDLSHVTESGLASEFIPYGIGCIKSYFKEHAECRDEFDVTLFKHPNLFVKSFLENNPDVVGFSNYCWNLDLSYAFAQEIKRISPETLVVSGGPNYPLKDEFREKWFKKHEAFDLYLVGEAEENFSKVVDHWHNNGSITDLKHAGIEGCHAIEDGKLINPSDHVPRLASLNSYPSPYLKGYMDEFLANEMFIPMTQTTRGCPYECTFCDKGSFMWAKITKLDSVELFAEEIHYIAQNTRSKLLCMTDDNFGLLPRDIEVAKVLAHSNEKYGYPYEITGTTNKNFSETTKKCIEILKGIFPVTVSVQSMDSEVLENIKRTNLPHDQLVKYAREGGGVGAASRSEMILCLPGDSMEKHIQGMLALMDANITFILSYTLIILDGTELGSEEDVSRWNMQTQFRLNHRCFGVYEFGEKKLHTGEIEEVVVSLNTLSFENYLETRSFVLTASIFYVDDILHELMDFLECIGIKPSQLILRIHNEGRCYYSPDLNNLYQSFNDATKNELWEDREALESLIKSTENLSEITEKGIGTNVIFKHRALALTELMEDIINVAFICTKDLIGSEYAAKYEEYLRELEQFMVLRRRNMFDCTQTYNAAFNYDFSHYVGEIQKKQGCVEVPSKLDHPMEITFFNTEKQKGTIGSFDSSFAGIMRLIVRVRLPHLFRVAKGRYTFSGELPTTV